MRLSDGIWEVYVEALGVEWGFVDHWNVLLVPLHEINTVGPWFRGPKEPGLGPYSSVFFFCVLTMFTYQKIAG